MVIESHCVEEGAEPVPVLAAVVAAVRNSTVEGGSEECRTVLEGFGGLLELVPFG